ncbi:hypothetical protein Rsub_04792 [Raphidocelis subcapitata]|uniref:TPX2 C-terminal domain-containing protein n=1 Tax=Raphidocelis subcapitata TaxID=307507 RepID=A0A2V0NZV8_9CHLO|nr:hypothetical protein Rsub_04792 [Raphidocelis subcapitata]|eukprot:GBF91123.1 hypothetical protein Rsub_04792 [Raphidocelis subcapitata]
MDGEFRFHGPSGAAAPRLADSWFQAARDKAAGDAGPSRPPLSSLQAGAPEQQQQQQQQQPAKPSNIRTSWGPAPAGGFKRAAVAPAAAATTTAAPAAAAAEPSAGQRAATGTPRPQRQRQRQDEEPGQQQQQHAPPASPGVATRSRCRALGLALTPPLERTRPGDFSPALPRGARTALKPRTPAHKRAAAAPRGRRLSRVIGPPISKQRRTARQGAAHPGGGGSPAGAAGRRSRSAGTASAAAAAAAAAPPGPSPYKSLAQRVAEFQNKTPPRFRRTPRGASAPAARRASVGGAQPQQQQPGRPQFTEARPFAFASDLRAAARRASTAGGAGRDSDGERAAPRTRVRAAAAQLAVGGGGGGGILAAVAAPPKPKPSLTIPRSPLLRTRARAASPAPRRSPPRSEFKARPVPSFDPFGARAVPFVAPKQPTAAKSPLLRTKLRGAAAEEAQAARAEEERRQEARARRVSARPLPLTTDMPAVPPRPEPREITVPAPYRLRSEPRHAEAAARHAQQLALEAAARRAAAEFRARPIAEGRPVEVRPSDAPLTVPVDPELATEARAVDRGEFDAGVAERMVQEEDERRRQGDLKRKREEAEEREYRKTLVFKARPMPTFEDPFFSAPSDKPLTKPTTPLTLRRQPRGCRGV